MNYRLDSRDERLWKGDQPVQISNKAFQLLRLFVSNRNRLLTKDDILDGVWGDLCVTEGLVKEYVHDLRVALGDDPKAPRFIETVHGRGYRFLGGVEEFKQAQNTSVRAEPGLHAPSLIVVPIKNLTDEERWKRFCNGLSDDLITDLARYPDFRVIAHNGSTVHFPNETHGISIDHNIVPQYVLSGSVQASDTQVRVNMRLVETGNDNHLWAERYDRKLGEVFNIQNEIVNQVASTIGGFSGQIPHAERLRLGRKPPEDLQAYELYLLAHELEARFEKRSTTKALELAQRAVELDPTYARAWLVVGWTCWQLSLEKSAYDPTDYFEKAVRPFRKRPHLTPWTHMPSWSWLQYGQVKGISKVQETHWNVPWILEEISPNYSSWLLVHWRLRLMSQCVQSNSSIRDYNALLFPRTGSKSAWHELHILLSTSIAPLKIRGALLPIC